MNYIEAQEASGLKIGDIVKVVRKAKDGEKGWDNSWIDDRMFIGDVGVIKSIDNEGITIFNNRYKFPYFVLEKVTKEEPKVYKYILTLTSEGGIVNLERLD